MPEGGPGTEAMSTLSSWSGEAGRKAAGSPLQICFPRLVLASGKMSSYCKMFELLRWKLSGVLEIRKDRNDNEATSKSNF